MNSASSVLRKPASRSLSSVVRSLVALTCALTLTSAIAQTLYVPGGTVGTSTNGGVGIGANSPRSALDVNGGATSAYSVETIGLWNVALASTVTTSGGTLDGGGPTKRGGGSCWSATATGQWIMFDLGSAGYINISGIGFGTFWRLDTRFIPAGYTIEVSTDGSSWSNYASATGNTSVSVMHYGGGYWRYVRITVTAFQSGYSNANITGIQILTDTRAALAGSEPWGLNINTNDVFLAGNANVGIGTTSPAAKLHVNAGISNAAIFEGATNYFTQFWNDGATSALLWGSNGAATDLRLGTVTGYSAENFSEKMRITGAGAVGIGTSAPQDKLHVSGSLRSDGSSTPGFYAFNGTTPLAAFQVDVAGDILNIGDFYGAAPSLALRLFTADVERFRIDTNGNVGIGTTSPSHKLAVNGAIRAKEVIVDTGWSDYVFADDYRLAPLSEVEAHIREKKHLPGIPSAVEVEAGGVSLGDMQAKLLAKVEEVTLHLIRMEKANAALRQEVEALKQSAHP